MKKNKFVKAVLLCLSIILCSGIFIGCSESEEDKARGKKFDVYKATTGLVEQKLKAPSTAKFQEFDEKLVQDLGGDKYEVSGYVDSENSFGAKIRWDWHCTVRIEGEGEDTMIKTDDIYFK